MLIKQVFVLLLLLVLSGCSALKPQEEPKLTYEMVTQKPLSPEETKELLSETGGNWLYGEGLGDTSINIGTAVVFPPYLFVMAGNAALSLAGYQSVGVSTFLPSEQAEDWQNFYGGIASGPGKVSAAIAGEEFRTKPVIKERMETLTEQLQISTVAPVSNESYFSSDS